MVDKTAFRWRLHRADTGELLVDRVSAACSVRSRFLGLMFRSKLPDRHGLLLVPCRSVHTMWMRFPVDLFFLSADGRVSEVRRNVRPWRAVLPKSGVKPHAVLEAGVGQVEVQIGTAVRVERIKPGVAPLPAALRFLCADTVRTSEE